MLIPNFKFKMPPVKATISSKAYLYQREFPAEFKVSPSGDLFCKLCINNVNCDKRFRVEKHRATSKHQKNLPTTPTVQLQQQFIPTSKNNFKRNLVESFMAADIPLFKLRHPQIVSLFGNLGQAVPSESACREHVMLLADAEPSRIKQILKDKKVFMVVDESEVNKMKFLNVLVGDTEFPEKTYLVDCSIIENVNQTTVSSKIDDCLRILEIPRENFVLLISDAASYMVACSAVLKVLYPNMFHLTCLAHLLHNCAEKVRSYFTDVDNLIARVKAVTVKNKTRQALFNEIGSPPQPVVTRWGTWLNAAMYYAEHFHEVKTIVNSFTGEGILVRNAKAAVSSDTVLASLVAIKRDYSVLPKTITKIESSKCSIREAHKFLTELDFKEDSAGIMAYLRKRMVKNADLGAIMQLSRPDVNPATYALLQQCQPTSASVERSFSMLNKLLVKDRNFLPNNIGKYLILHYNLCKSNN